MKRTFALVVVFLVGVTAGAFAAKKGIDSSLFAGKKPKEAADALLVVAKEQAGKGSWERIALARVYYLSGRKAEAEAIFGEVTAKKPEGSDWLRIGRVYYEAGEWDKAKGAFDKALALSPKDAPWLGEFEIEMKAFPGGRHDDQVDSVSQFLAWATTRKSIYHFG